MKLVQCANCGQSINRKRDVCPFCQAAVVRSAPRPESAAPVGGAEVHDEPVEVISAPTPPWTHSKVIFLVVVVGVGLLAAALLAVVLSMAPSKLTPEQIYEERVGGVVEIRAVFPSTYNAYGQLTIGGESQGTGFVVSRDGYILTNAHVVSESGRVASTVRVIVKGRDTKGTPLEGTVIGADETTDVALVKIDPSRAPKLQPVPLGDSSLAAVGEEVVAIGNPLGFEFSLSRGVISGIGRELESPDGTTITGGIQTDAAINPGSSGGPLIDATGHVIGINYMIATMSGGNEGIGFAVPINTAIRVMKQMKASAPGQ